MFRPPGRSTVSAAVATLVAATIFVAPAAAQQPETGIAPVGEAVAAAFISLVVGGGLILLAPDYTDRTTQRILDEPGRTVLHGIGIGFLAMIALVVLILTVVGILLAIPLAIVLVVFGELGYLAVGRLFTDDWSVVLLVAVGTSAIVGGLPVLGALLGLVLSSLGLGAAYLEYADDGRSGTDRSRRTNRSTGGTADRTRPRR